MEAQWFRTWLVWWTFDLKVGSSPSLISAISLYSTLSLFSQVYKLCVVPTSMVLGDNIMMDASIPSTED